MLQGRQLIGVAFLCALFLTFGVPVARGLDRYEIIARYNNSVVKVEHSEIGESEHDWSGSGFFYTKTRIITNAHVVGSLIGSAEEFQAVHTDEDIARAMYWIIFAGKKYKARFVGRDADADIAILETVEEIPGVVPVELGNSDTVNVGHSVLVFGSPHEFVGSVTDGMISGKRRRHGMVAYEDYLQTSAPVNPGNSGGPLVSAETGEVIGIVNSKIGSADGMGFAIPINIFRYMEPDMLRGTARRSWLGIKFPFEEDFHDAGEFQALNEINKLTGVDQLETLKRMRKEIFVDGGVLITDIMQREVSYFNSRLKCAGDSWNGGEGDLTPPAKKVGLHIGDIIKSFGTEKITNSRELIYSIFQTKPCETIRLHIVRFDENGVRQELDANLTTILRNPKGISAGYY